MPNRVVIVDDEVDLVEAMRFRFEQEGWSTSAAHRGSDAIATILDGEAPRLVLLDHQLPDMTGCDVCAAVRDALRHTSIVMFTAHGSPELQSAAAKVGIDDFLLKPISVTELLARLDR